VGWGGGRELLTWQPLAFNFNVSSNLSKKVNIFFKLIANLVDNKKTLKLIVSLETALRALQQPGEGIRDMPYHGQVSCDLIYLVDVT
jgi:hypothetical protein